MKQTDALISKFILVKTLHVLGSSSTHHQESATVHLALHVIQAWRQLACRIRMECVPSSSCTLAVIKPVQHVPVQNVQWLTPDDG